MIVYTTKEGDVLDWICWRHYGATNVLEEVLKVNPGVSAFEKMPAGVVIKLPYIDTTNKNKNEVKLWN